MIKNTLKNKGKSLKLTTLGFTLIELLAVIVILAIIALIATPIVLSIIDDTKKSSMLHSAEMYIDGLEISMASTTINKSKVQDGTYEIMSDGNVCLGTLEDNLEKESYICSTTKNRTLERRLHKKLQPPS